MIIEKADVLNASLKAGISPILMKDVTSDTFINSVVLKANIDKSELVGHYEDVEYLPPAWYDELIEKSKNGYSMLVIENINEVSVEEQTKFIEILKYKKVSTFDLPKNCLIVVTCINSSEKRLNEEIDSLVAYV